MACLLPLRRGSGCIVRPVFIHGCALMSSSHLEAISNLDAGASANCLSSCLDAPPQASRSSLSSALAPQPMGNTHDRQVNPGPVSYVSGIPAARCHPLRYRMPGRVTLTSRLFFSLWKLQVPCTANPRGFCQSGPEPHRAHQRQWGSGLRCCSSCSPLPGPPLVEKGINHEMGASKEKADKKTSGKLRDFVVLTNHSQRVRMG
ncbi:hypothetical protein B0T26DRAFT_510991 [Lasiosphaeria miniovina]|uniref:Uncharacterized protein n=1 Tax=Lasiosphaeria miniovina TaxID=1954250 RepID=A0AA39ZUF9_9PEZI|nr:uncharacterized protein B0T26DRAFT_510991 [Lasiosphaeria miniovina]KAK0703751.1 hypothetical protein B0T26DRAFT_510991 [Lasiosphaeria miniovina]